MTAPAAAAEQNGRLALRPNSVSAGTENATSTPIYKNAPIPRKGSGIPGYSKQTPYFVEKTKKRSSSGTSIVCSAATARFPRRSTPTANTSPKRDTNGLNDGIIASSPASIPADGASETIGNTVFTAAAARPNKA